MKRKITAILLVAALGFAATPLFADPAPAFPYDISTVNAFDRALMQPYNGKLNLPATIIEYSLLAAPGAFVLVPGADWFSDGLMYAETGILTFCTGKLLKNAIGRVRPCMYYDSYPQELIDDDDWNKSLPSGHTTMCFMSAAFVTYMFNTRYPDSEWKLPAIIAAYGLAAGTGALRMAGGYHFLSDILAGAALGTATGFLIPWAHDQISSLIAGSSVSGSGSALTVNALISPFSLGFVLFF